MRGVATSTTRLIAGISAVVAVFLALSTNIASTLVPDEWTKQHSALVWAVTALLALATIALLVMAARGDGSTTAQEPSIDVSDTRGTVVMAGPGATVRIGSVEPEPVPEQRVGQIVVGELPGVPPAFVEREAVAGVTAVFAKGGRVATVTALTGARGAGKTQVAAEYARRAVADGVGLVAWVSAEEQDRLLAGLAEVADRIGVADPEGDSARSAGRVRDALATRADRALLVVDNAKDPQAVRRYLPTIGPTEVVITSTDLAFRSFGTPVDVDVFDRAQSVAYLATRTQLADNTGADAVATELGDLPLALAQASSVIESQALSYDAYLERLCALALDEMLNVDPGDPYPHSLAGAVLLSVEAVENADLVGLTKRALATVALLAPEGVDRSVLADLLEAAAREDLDATVGSLVQASLLVWTTDRRGVVMHRLVARTIRDRLAATGELEQFVNAVAQGLEPLLVPEAQAWQWRQEITEIVGHAVGLWENVVSAADREILGREQVVVHTRLAHWTVRHLNVTADFSRAMEIGTSVLQSCERVLGPDHRDTLTSRNNLAGAYEAAGDLSRATPLHEETLAGSERVLGPDHPDTLTSRNNLAGAYETAGDLSRAIPLYEETLAGRERVLGPDHPNTLTSRNNLAGAYRAAGDLSRATPLYEETLSVCERVLSDQHLITVRVRRNLETARAEQHRPRA
jgi:tetratricopeptide (TPR) repeat protein